MKSKVKKKVFSGIAVLAVAASAIAGTVALTNSNKGNSYLQSETDLDHNVIATAWGGAQQQQGGGKTYYVSPNGTGTEYSETNPGSIGALLHDEYEDSFQSPVGPGDTVIVKAGEYHLGNTDIDNSTDTKDDNLSATAGLVFRKSGEYNNYIKIVAEDGTTPVLNFDSQKFGPRGVQIYGNYVYWAGINIEGAGDNGMFIAGSYNTIENCEFSFCRDTGLQLGRSKSDLTSIRQWPNYNLIKNCTSHNNYDNESAGENADGFAAKLTVGYGNVFDGCIAYRNSDDGWDLYAKNDSGNIGTVILYNCVAFENGFIESTQHDYNARFDNADKSKLEDTAVYDDKYTTANGDGNGFKLGGENMEADVYIYNCLAFHNRLHGFTDNSNPGVITIKNCTSYDNGRAVDNATNSPTLGQVIDGSSGGTSTSDWSSNVDLSRHANSYNIVENVLSVKGVLSGGVADDEYRGSVRDSILTRGAKYYKIDGVLDADAKNGITGEETTALVASEIFEQLPVVKDGETLTYNITGKDSYKSSTPIHKQLRNSDGSVNMDTMLKINNRGAFINGVDLGADLSKTSQSGYESFEAENPYADAKTANEAVVERAKNALVIPVDADAVYQDFEVPVQMAGTSGMVSVEWSTDKADLLEITDIKKESVSLINTITIIVHRQPDDNKTATLTATLTYGSGANQVKATKEFELTIVKNEYKLGKLIATDADGNVLADGSSIILDSYTIYREPTITVENGYDYNGKLLPEDKYEISAKYEWQENSNAPKIEVKGYTPSHAGVFTITYTAEMGKTKSSLTLYIYNASPEAQVDFTDSTSEVVVYRDGFSIAGAVNSPKGKIYTVVSPTALNDVTKENIKTYNGVKADTFEGVSIKFEYENANTADYYVYYALGNNNGDITSSAVYTAEVKVIDISTKADFRKIAGGEKIGTENPATTIYKLTTDLDFGTNDYTWDVWTNSAKAFTGLFNGAGHTISNITLKAGTSSTVGSNTSNVFYQVKGGTIMNVKFENIDLEGYRVVAIVGTCYGGYFYNIAMKNINASGNQRVAALIGTVGETESVPVYIDQVSLTNDITNNTTCLIKATENDSRSGGLIGLVQCEKNDDIGSQIYISNCAVVTNGQVYSDFGGMVGCYEDQTASYALEITNCMYYGNILATGGVRCSGIYGYHKGGYSDVKITGCLVAIPSFSANGINVNEIPQKNASALWGQWSGSHTIASNCATIGVGVYEQGATYSGINAYSADSVAIQALTNVCKFDLEDRWTAVTVAGDDQHIQAPYLTLNFLGDWD